MFNVIIQVITVAAGADMEARAREIAHHYDTQARSILPAPYFYCCTSIDNL